MGVISKEEIKKFKESSVIYIPDFLSKELCSEMLTYLEDNEDKIIDRFRARKRFLSIEEFNNKEAIKYFEFPMEDNADLFGQAINSKMFETAKALLSKDVRIKSVEIHSRFPGSTSIPIHQDNAYYGLENASALTFYIALNEQKESEGGLIYIKNNHINEFNHDNSNISGFSLTINNANAKKVKQEIRYNFNAGDCSIHHARSIHFAEEVPKLSKRSWVLRTSLYGIDAKVRSGHKDWYLSKINSNRLSSNK